MGYFPNVTWGGLNIVYAKENATSFRHKGRLNYPPYVWQNRHYKKAVNLFLIYPFCTTRYDASRSVAQMRYESDRPVAGGRRYRVGGTRGGILR